MHWPQEYQCSLNNPQILLRIWWSVFQCIDPHTMTSFFSVVLTAWMENSCLQGEVRKCKLAQHTLVLMFPYTLVHLTWININQDSASYLHLCNVSIKWIYLIWHHDRQPVAAHVFPFYFFTDVTIEPDKRKLLNGKNIPGLLADDSEGGLSSNQHPLGFSQEENFVTLLREGKLKICSSMTPIKCMDHLNQNK